MTTWSWIRRLLARTPRRRRKAGTPVSAPARGIDVIPAHGDGTFSSPIKSCSEIGRSTLLAVGDLNGDRELGLLQTRGDRAFNALLGNGDGL
jgi:hypothetical protein